MRNLEAERIKFASAEISGDTVMKQRLHAEERREHLLSVMQEVYQQTKQQSEFTAAKVAEQAGVSSVFLYRLVGTEFKALRSQLPGPRHPRDEEIKGLRQKIAELEKQLREAQDRLRTTAISELGESIFQLEQYEQENLQLREEISLLRERIEQGGQVIVSLPRKHR